MDGAYFRVHHFAQQLASPFPLLAAVGARTRKIEIGTAVIDMRYENPHYMAEDAGAADLISGGRLQLGISLGSPSRSSMVGAILATAPCRAATQEILQQAAGPHLHRPLLSPA
jgi:alkanesulfonate monooxygenase SsuD/methylene tetrahydromethanopterin reductase-like flavin-dependent oxidoreductase (luciferase family)